MIDYKKTFENFGNGKWDDFDVYLMENHGVESWEDLDQEGLETVLDDLGSSMKIFKKEKKKMTVKQAQAQARRFMKRTGFLVSWYEIKKAIETDGKIWRKGKSYQAREKVKL